MRRMGLSLVVVVLGIALTGCGGSGLPVAKNCQEIREELQAKEQPGAKYQAFECSEKPR